MFRISGRRPPATPDDVALERLLDGGSIDDLPDALKPLREVLAAATNAPNRQELDGATAAAAAFVTARAAAGHRARRTRSVGISMFAALAFVASTGTAVAATRGTLPDAIQQVAHEALGVVGISVPSINDDDASPGHAPVDATDSPSGPAVSSVNDPTAGGSTTGPSPAGSSAGGTATGPGPSGGPPDGTPGNDASQSGDAGPSTTTPGAVDTPGDQGGGRIPDPAAPPGNRDFGHGQGNAPGVPPGQVKKG